VGVLKLGTLWPLPKRFIEKQMMRTTKVLVVEEVDPFVENQIRVMVSESETLKGVRIHGKLSGHLNYYGEITPDLVTKALSKILNRDYQARDPGMKRKCVRSIPSLLSGLSPGVLAVLIGLLFLF